MKTRMFQTVLIASLLSTSAFAQFQISGTIKNDLGESMQGVSITIKGENIGSYSQEEGKYRITNLKKGEYEVEARFFGYESLSKIITVEQDVKADFVLKSSIFLQEEVTIHGIRAGRKTPTTYTNKSAEEIGKENYGQDLPYLLESMPSTIVTSDAGAGIGYTDFKIRGVDPTRTNITIDGIPINDAETQTVFWVNTPDLSSSVSSMQVQRGVGTSSNGGSAFGASINIETNKIEEKPYLTLDNSVGSFRSLKNTVALGTGLISERFTVDARLSRIVSDGYMDRASSNLKSFYLSGAYHSDKHLLRINVFSGVEKTYQAWNGVPESRINNDKEGMIDYANRNGLDAEDLENLLNSGRTYNSAMYHNETDNYQQDHYQIHYAYQMNRKWNVKVAGHYTRGRGYYENYRKNDKFSTYNFSPIEVEGETINRMDLIRQKWLDNHFFGGIFSFNYNNLKGLELTLGGSLHKYMGDHFGNVIWAQYLPNLNDGVKYYENNSVKYDGNIYLKGTYEVRNLTIFADAQYRHIDYTFLGINDIGDEIIDVDQQVFYNFFNPKIGLSYQISNNHSLYASYAIGNREPVRKDFQEQTVSNRPEHETLYNLEAGYQMKYRKGFLNANIYHMLYENQLVLTGEINDVGGYTRTNVEDSYRMGVELEVGYQPVKQFGVSANLALSQNKINNFVEYVDSYDASWNPLPQTKIEHGTTDLAFSPNVITGLTLRYMPFNNFEIGLINKYVGKQYLDNTSNETRILNNYFLTHFDVSYSFKFYKFKEITVGARINNLLNYKYENNGYTFSYLVGDERTQENFYFPQAGINFMARLVIKL
ncbi:MAG: TonB-dependent receptor [Brumimicrobium sp.]